MAPCALGATPVGEWPLLYPLPRVQLIFEHIFTAPWYQPPVEVRLRVEERTGGRPQDAAHPGPSGTGAADLLSAGHSPTSALVTGLFLPATMPTNGGSADRPEGCG